MEFQAIRIKPRMQHGSHNLIQQGISLNFSRFSGNNGHINEATIFIAQRQANYLWFTLTSSLSDVSIL